MPGGEEILRLKQRGGEFSIMIGASELMNSRLSGSEEALATLAATRLRACSAPRVLIGGLGMGFTLKAALAAFPRDAALIVAELVPAVAEWARGPMASLFGGALDDPRVALRIADVADVIGEGRYDAILLDVDNGPEGLTRIANDRIYSERGLSAARTALNSGGILAVWSATRDQPFMERLKRAGFTVEEAMVRAHRGTSGARHTIWLAKKG